MARSIAPRTRVSAPMAVLLAALACPVLPVTAGSAYGQISDRVAESVDGPERWSSSSPRGLAVASLGVRPEEFGAVGDGVTDDRAALQQAIAAAAHRRLPVLLGARTYRSTGWLRLPSHTRIVGEGSASVLAFTWRYNEAAHDGYYLGNRDQLGGNVDIVLRDFVVHGAGSGEPSGPASMHPAPLVPAIRMRLVTGLTITRVEVRRAVGIAVLVQGVRTARLIDNWVHDVGRDGLHVGWFHRDAVDVLVAGNRVQRPGDDGIAVVGGVPGTPLASPWNVRVRSNTVLGRWRNTNGRMMGRGLSSLGARQVLFADNVVDRTQGYGVLIAGSTRPDRVDPATGEQWRAARIGFRDNRILHAGWLSDGALPGLEPSGVDGVVVKRSDDVELTGNVVRYSRGGWILLYDCVRCGPQGAG